MALTKELIVSNPSLKVLNDDQIAQIVTLSVNDENVVIGERIGKLHGDYENDILTVSGLPKNQGEKAYDYNKRVIKYFKEKAESATTLQGQIDTLTREKGTLEQQIKEGKGNEIINQKLKDIETERDLLKNQLTKEQRERKEFEDQSNKTLLNYKVNSLIDMEASKFAFKKDLPENIVKIVMDEAKRKMLTENNPAFVEVDGKEVLVFRDEKGEIKRDPANALNPFTAQTLLKGYLKDAIDEGAGGGAGTGNDTKKPTLAITSLSSAKTQSEALDIIEKHLLGKGIERLSESFEQEKAKFWKEYNVRSLPEA